jgi:hypothetical protein
VGWVMEVEGKVCREEELEGDTRVTMAPRDGKVGSFSFLLPVPCCFLPIEELKRFEEFEVSEECLNRTCKWRYIERDWN